MDNLPREIRTGLRSGAQRAGRTDPQLTVEAGGQRIRVLRVWPTGFSVEAGASGILRGHVDLFDGAKLLSRCLIVTAQEEEDERIYEFKRATLAADHPPLDFARDGDVI